VVEAKDTLFVAFYVDAVYTLKNVADCHSMPLNPCANVQRHGKKASPKLQYLRKAMS
jgi:hypothetical protein